jgi:hypothetical protein
MNYNEIFTIVDTEKSGDSRYCVSNTDGSGKVLLVGDKVTGEFNWGKSKMNGKEKSFDELPDTVQDHIVDAFELNEKDSKKKKCKCEKECKKCVAGSPCECDGKCADMISELWTEVILSVIEEDTEAAAFGVKNIIMDKFKKVITPTLQEFNMGKIKLKGNDVHVNGKVVGKINTDPSDTTKGITFTGEDNKEHEFDSITDFYEHIMDEFRITESEMGTRDFEFKVAFAKSVEELRSVVTKELKNLGYDHDLDPKRYKSISGRIVNKGSPKSILASQLLRLAAERLMDFENIGKRTNRMEQR